MVIDWGLVGLGIALIVFLLGELTHVGIFHLIAGFIGIGSTITLGREIGEILYWMMICVSLLFMARSMTVRERS